jgi:CheY-like chemotaxis protein
MYSTGRGAKVAHQARELVEPGGCSVSTDARNLKVLVVDDERSACQSVDKVLRRRGHVVVQSLSVPEALEAIASSPELDLVIADLMMPQVGGIELLRSASARWPDLPVLVVTGYTSIASAVEATRLGAVGYLQKPFTPDELERAVGEAAARRPRLAYRRPAEPDATIDVDLPFDPREVADATSPGYVRHLTRSDVPLVDHRKPLPADFCALGQRSCKRYKTKGICRDQECPLIVAERRKRSRLRAVRPMVVDPIDVDMPFSESEVALATSEAYVAALGRSDLPVVGHWPEEPSRRILAVDDEPVVVNSIRKALTRKGYVVEEAFNGVAALDRVASEDFDLVLLDMRMPDANGLELLPKLKSLRPDLPVVIVTGYASIDTAVQAVQSGASDYLPKPFTADELYQMARRVLERTAA